MKPEIFKTPDSGELITKLRVTGVDSKGLRLPYKPEVLFSLPIDLEKGDLLDIRAYGQTSNANKFSVNPYGVVSSAIMFCYGIILAEFPNSTDGIEVTEVRGTNITYEIHHSPWNCGDYFKWETLPSKKYVNVICYAASMAIGPNSTPTYLDIDKDYGRLTVALWR